MIRPQLTLSLRLLLCVVAVLRLPSCTGQDSSLPVTVSKSLVGQSLPILLAPNNLTGSLHFAASYTLSQPSSRSLAVGTTTNFSMFANSTLLIPGFNWVSCAAMQLSAPDSVYAFVTNAAVMQFTASSGQQDYSLYREASSSSGTFLASALPFNGTISKLLALGPNATSATGAVPTSSSFNDTLTLVVVNPTSNSPNVMLEVGLSPLGPCNTCSTQRDSGGLLGNCGDTLNSATIVVGNTVQSAVSQKPFLQPIQKTVRDIERGSSSVFAVFTNAACMMYTVKDLAVPTDLSQTKPQLTAWVATAAQQNQTVTSVNVTAAQRLNFGCSYPAWTDLNRPCYNYTQALDPNETYYLWVQNANTSAPSSAGNVTVIFELMVLRDTADCSQARFFNLSASSQYLNNASTPLNYTLATAVNRSQYDPGVTPFAFIPGSYNANSSFPVMAVGSDSSLSQVGSWNITPGLASNAYAAQVTLASTNSIVVNMLESRFPGGNFSNAACFYESLNASNDATSYLLPKLALFANFNFSNAVPSTALNPDAFNSHVLGSDHFKTRAVSATTTGLSLNETYSFVVQTPYDNTAVSTQTTAYPAGSAFCQNAGAAAAPAAAQNSSSSASPGAVRGVFDGSLSNLSGDGGATNVAAITGAACIAFVISARGLRVNGTGPVLYSQYYNVSSPGNTTDPNLNASAILLQGSALNQQFITNGFPDPANPPGSTTPLPIVTGCLVNYTSPGPCLAYADNLNSSELYYLWGVNGARSPVSWFLISYEARPSGSCKNAYVLPTINTVGPSPAPPPPPPTPSPTPSVSGNGTTSSKVSTGVIAGSTVGGVVAIAAAVGLLFVCLRKPKPVEALLPPLIKSNSNAFLESRVDEETDNYAFYKDVLDPEGNVIGRSSVPTPILKTDSTDPKSKDTGPTSDSTIGSGPKMSADHGPDPEALIATINAAASSRSRSDSGPQTPSSPTLYLEQWDFNLTELKLKIVNGKPLKLGEGGFGAVYLGFLGVREVAVKIATGTSAAQRDSFLHEIHILKGCRDPNIVLFLGASVGEEIVLLMEFMRGGDLFKAIRNDTRNQFRWNKGGAKLALDIAKGLYHLHSKGIIHLDMKSPNILLSYDRRHAKISDVGLAKFTTDAGTRPGGGLSFAWASPEQILGGKCTAASDMFSFGVILWEICTGESPTNSRVYRQIQTPEECPLAVADLVAQCLMEAPMRPTAQEAHRILKKFAQSD